MQHLKRNTLKKVAKKNTTIKVKDEVVREGTPLEHSVVHGVPSSSGIVVGISKGVTKNMGDYQSLRVDVWLSDTVQKGETTEEAYERISSIVDETLEEAVFDMSDE